MEATGTNQWWKLRSKHGRNKKFATPELLWEACEQYFEQTSKRKWNRVTYVGPLLTKVIIPTEVPFTLTGLCLFLNIGRSTWNDYKNKKGYEHFSDIVTRAEVIIFAHKFEGAAVGIFNASIIARNLAMVERKELEPKTGPLPVHFTINRRDANNGAAPN